MKALLLSWLFQNAVLGGGLLTAGCFLAARCRSPVRRLRLLEWTLVAALIAPVLALTDGPWKLPLRWLPAGPAPVSTTTTVSAPLQVAHVLTNPALAGPPVFAGYEHETGVVGAAEPAVREPAAESWNWPDWRVVVLVVEALAIVLLGAKWLVSAMALACLSYTAKAVDAKLVARIEEQLPARLRPSATIRLDPNVSTPCVFGLFRPCILLPEFLTGAGRAQQMIFALAHESSHILRGDLWSWRLVRVAQFALWFQPAYWWLRRQTRLCQDFLADFDATMVGQPADLADFLLQLARIQQSPLAVTALSMRSRRTDLARRINMLLSPQSKFECRCPRRFQAFLALAVFSIIGMAAVLRLEAQDRATELKPKESQSLAGSGSKLNQGSATQVRGRVLGPDGKPVWGAKLYLGAVPKGNGGEPELRFHRDQKEMKSTARATSDSDGHFDFVFSNAELIKMGHEHFSGGVRDVVGEVMAVASGHGCGWAEIDRAAKELTIHMVDDLPVAGRILDSDGRPVAAARIRVIGIGTVPRGDLSEFLIAMQNEPNMNTKFWTAWNGSLPGQPSIIASGDDGRFQLTGIGRERLALVSIEGPRIATTFSWVMTRTGETVKRRKPWDSIFAASFDYVGQPSRVITGTVRNRATGKPMAGAWVYLWGKSGMIKTATSDNGRYELCGAPKAPTYQLVAASDDGLFFDRQLQVQDTPGLDGLKCDIELVSWLTVHGRVTEKETGKPVAGAQVDYHPLAGNPYVNKLVPGSWSPQSETISLPDGSYTLTVMPGPGAIGVRGPNLNDYAPAVVTREQCKQFFKTASVFAYIYDDNYLQTAGGGDSRGCILADYCNGLVLIEPGEEENAIVRDVSLERPYEIKGRILGPDSQPLPGTTVYGLIRLSVETLKGSEFTVRGVNPKAKRPLVFYHKEKQLGYYLKEIDANSARPLTVKLVRCGSVSGRTVDEDRQPVAGETVDVRANTFKSGSEQCGGEHRLVTDANGRFHLVGLVPGQQYSVECGRFYADITVEAGRDKDLGDINMKASMN